MAKALFTFANFQSDEYVESSDAKINTEVRKAHKKLREIDILKKKEMKTKEELDKIQMEIHWLSILFPNEEKAVDEERKRKQQKRHDEKERIKERKRKAEEIANERRREEERKREELRQEREAREQSRKERDQSSVFMSQKKSPIERRIEKEFVQLLSENDNNVNKVFRLLSFKYHPDKHLDDKSGSEEIQKILGNIKEMYLEI
jgi:chromosome segregation ATPase